jgi:hypothetical protein
MRGEAELDIGERSFVRRQASVGAARNHLVISNLAENSALPCFQRMKGITFPPSKNVLIPSSATVRSNSASAS